MVSSREGKMKDYTEDVIQLCQKHIVDPHRLQDYEEYWHSSWDHILNMDLWDKLDNIISILDKKNIWKHEYFKGIELTRKEKIKFIRVVLYLELPVQLGEQVMKKLSQSDPRGGTQNQTATTQPKDESNG